MLRGDHEEEAGSEQGLEESRERKAKKRAGEGGGRVPGLAPTGMKGSRHLSSQRSDGCVFGAGYGVCFFCKHKELVLFLDTVTTPGAELLLRGSPCSVASTDPSWLFPEIPWAAGSSRGSAHVLGVAALR